MSEETGKVVLAYCGLLCSKCGAFLKGRCKGCHGEKPMSVNCKIKPCVSEKGYKTCAECDSFTNLKDCKKLNNLISKIFGFIFRSDRIGNLNCVRRIGLDKFEEQNR